MQLRETIRSYTGAIYGNAGDKVKIITQSPCMTGNDEVVIVQNEEGNRFATMASSLTNEAVLININTENIINRQPIRKQRKAATNTPSLF